MAPTSTLPRGLIPRTISLHEPLGLSRPQWLEVMSGPSPPLKQAVSTAIRTNDTSLALWLLPVIERIRNSHLYIKALRDFLAYRGVDDTILGVTTVPEVEVTNPMVEAIDENDSVLCGVSTSYWDGVKIRLCPYCHRRFRNDRNEAPIHHIRACARYMASQGQLVYCGCGKVERQQCASSPVPSSPPRAPPPLRRKGRRISFD